MKNKGTTTQKRYETEKLLFLELDIISFKKSLFETNPSVLAQSVKRYKGLKRNTSIHI